MCHVPFFSVVSIEFISSFSKSGKTVAIRRIVMLWVVFFPHWKVRISVAFRLVYHSGRWSQWLIGQLTQTIHAKWFFRRRNISLFGASSWKKIAHGKPLLLPMFCWIEFSSQWIWQTSLLIEFSAWNYCADIHRDTVYMNQIESPKIDW